MSNAKLLERAEKLIDFYNPEVVLLGCLKKIIEHYNKLWFECSREQIRFVFEQFEAKSKHEIAQLLIKQFPELENRMLKKRHGISDSDDYRRN